MSSVKYAWSLHRNVYLSRSKMKNNKTKIFLVFSLLFQGFIINSIVSTTVEAAACDDRKSKTIRELRGRKDFNSRSNAISRQFNSNCLDAIYRPQFQYDTCSVAPDYNISGRGRRINDPLKKTCDTSTNPYGTYIIYDYYYDYASPACPSNHPYYTYVPNTNPKEEYHDCWNTPPINVSTNGPFTINIGGTINFNASAIDLDNDTITYEWNFGDGSPIRTGQSVQHTYTGPNPEYTVTLVADDGWRDGEVTRQTTVTINRHPVAHPGGPYSTIINGTINFDASDTTDDGVARPGGQASLTYNWRWSNGISSGSLGTGIHPSYMFTQVGDYTVTLTVTDNMGLSDTTSVPVKIVDPLTFLKGDPELNLGSGFCDGTNPINSATGNKYQVETDYVGVGPFPLVFQRHYNSYVGTTPSFGKRWRHSYDRELVINTSSTNSIARITLASGRKITFESIDQGTTWQTTTAVVTDRLETIPGGGWRLVTENDIREIYETVPGIANQGRLKQLINPQGFIQTLNYFSDGNLENIIDSFNRSISLYYVSGVLHILTDSASQNTIYRYSGGYLTTVTYPENPSQHKRYYYDESTKNLSSYQGFLTGVLENGKRFSTYHYDAQGRATLSEHAVNASKVRVAYDTDPDNLNKTVVTHVNTADSAKNQSRTYTYSNQLGKLKIDLIEGPECNVCGGAGANNTYDPLTGQLDTAIDFKGNQTDYNYNARGLPDTITQAVGAQNNDGISIERVLNYTWHATYRVPTCVVGPYNSTIFTYEADSARLSNKTIVDTTDDILFPTPASKNCSTIQNRADYASLNKRTWGYTFYPNGIKAGLVWTVDGPRIDVSDVTTFLYDDITGNLAEVRGPLYSVHPDSPSIRYTIYDLHGRAVRIMDQNGLVTRIAYDQRGRVDLVSVGDGFGTGLVGDAKTNEITNYDYHTGGMLKQVTNPDGTIMKYEYDDAQRLTDVYEVFGPIHNVVHYVRDYMGNAETTEVRSGVSYGSSTSTGEPRRRSGAEYNRENRLIRLLGAGTPQQITKFIDPATGLGAYDGNGNLTYMEDAEGNKTRYAYDAHNRLETITDDKNGLTKYTYDLENRIKTVTDPNNVTTTYAYDGLGNIETVDSPDAGLVQYTDYDDGGNLKTKITANDITVNYEYDVLNRLDLVTYPNGETIDYVYDTGGAANNEIGKLVSVVSNPGSSTVSSLGGNTTYGYDDKGRIKNKIQVLDSVALSIDYIYDNQGKLDKIIYPSGTQLKFNYNSGRIDRLNIVGGATIIDNMEYEPFGPLSKWNLVNGQIVQKRYDLDGQIDSYALGSGNRSLQYYLNGNLEKITDTDNAANDETYIYDTLNRVENYNRPGPKVSYNFVYDNNRAGNGNRTSQTIGNVTQNYSYVPTSNRLLNEGQAGSSDYAYDTAGNISNDGMFQYDYDARERITRINNAAGTINYASYVINEQGQRIGKTTQNLSTVRPGDANNDGVIDQADFDLTTNVILGTATASGDADCNQDMRYTVQDLVCINFSRGTTSLTTYYVYNESGQLIGEYNQYGVVIREYVWFGNIPIAILTGDQVYYIYSDHLNTPREVVNSANQVVWRWVSDPFGEALPNEDPDGDGNKFRLNLRFPGQYYDVESGLHYNYHRTYNPRTGRYIEADPIGLEGGLNIYGYTEGNPVNLFDMYGLDASLYCKDAAVADPSDLVCPPKQITINELIRYNTINLMLGGLGLGRMCLSRGVVSANGVSRVGETVKNITEVPLKDILPLHGVPRPGMPKNWISELANKIKSEGYNVKHAIPVLRLPNGKLVSAGGHHRVAAMKSLRENSIPSRIVDWTSLSGKAQQRYLNNSNFGAVLKGYLK